MSSDNSGHPHLHWFADPLVLVPLALLAGIYIWRFVQARKEVAREAGGGAPGGGALGGGGPGGCAPGGGAPGGGGAAARGVGPLQAIAFAAGMLALLAALVSPLDGLGEDYLFSAHMVQHVLLGDIAPLLILLGLSRVIMRPATRRLSSIERRLGPLASPAAGIVLWLLLMYLWHVPALYDAAVEHPLIHLLEHVSFFVAGVALWWPLVQPVPMRRRLTGMQPVAYIGSAKAGLAALGIFLTWSTTAIYPYYEDTPRIWGLSPIEDQNVAGVIMMLEQSITLVVVLVALFIRALAQSETDQLRRERLEERQAEAARGA